MNTGFFVARIVLGLAMSAHGAQKLFGWFGGYGLRGTGGFMEGLGFRPGALFALAAGLGELVGGLLTALGLFGAVGPALIVLVMVVAIGSVHWANGFFAQANGIELPLLYLIGTVMLAFAGKQGYSIDRLLGLTALSQPTVTWVLVAAGVVSGVLLLALRQPAAQVAHGAA